MAEERNSESVFQDSVDVPLPGRERKKPDKPGRESRRPPSDSDDRRRKAQQQRRRRNSVFQYIAILFMAAFVLLLYTYMMERRQNQQQIDDLKQSASAYQTLQGLIEENDQLKEEVQGLNDQIKALENQLTGAQEGQGLLQAQLQNEEEIVSAMTWFWQLNDAYVRGRLTQCRELIASMEEADLTGLLPKENTASEDFLSPAERYEEIHTRVIP